MRRAAYIAFLAGFLALVGGSHASTSRVASSKAGRCDVYSVRVDGSNLRDLSGAQSWDEDNAVWSPNGRMIAFLVGRIREQQLARALYVMRRDGSFKRRITPGNLVVGRIADPPTWSPDGSTIAFSARTKSRAGIWAVRPDGRGLRMLVPLGFEPAWSPGGRSIAFATRHGLRVVSVRGGRMLRLTHDATDSHPTWSPAGTMIAFTRFAGAGQRDSLYVVAAQGGRAHRVLAARAGELSPASWSPDGRKLLSADWHSIYLAQVNGSPARALRAGDLPAWSPDGARIAFSVASTLYVMRSDGTNPGQVSSATGGDLAEGPVWSPDGQTLLFAASC